MRDCQGVVWKKIGSFSWGSWIGLLLDKKNAYPVEVQNSPGAICFQIGPSIEMAWSAFFLSYGNTTGIPSRKNQTGQSGKGANFPIYSSENLPNLRNLPIITKIPKNSKYFFMGAAGAPGPPRMKRPASKMETRKNVDEKAWNEGTRRRQE